MTLSGERGAYAHGRQKGESDSRLAPVDEYAIFDTQREFVYSRGSEREPLCERQEHHGAAAWWGSEEGASRLG